MNTNNCHIGKKIMSTYKNTYLKQLPLKNIVEVWQRFRRSLYFISADGLAAVSRDQEVCHVSKR